MARSEHNRQAYFALFGYVGGALQAFGVLLVVISFPIAPLWVSVSLLVVGLTACAWSWTRYRDMFMMPTFVGIGLALAWMLVVGLGAMVLGWRP